MSRPTPLPPRLAHRLGRQRGLTLVELMIGLLVGLMIMASALTLTAVQLGERARLSLELQLQQELRAIVQLMRHDLPRAGGWAQPARGVWRDGDGPAAANPHARVSIDSSGTRLDYSYARAEDRADGSDEGGGVDANEQFGFRLRDEQLEYRLAGVYQPLTDRKLLRVLAFEARLDGPRQPLPDLCERPCPANTPDCPPWVAVRELHLRLVAASALDSGLRRQVRLDLRLPNDDRGGRCAAPAASGP